MNPFEEELWREAYGDGGWNVWSALSERINDWQRMYDKYWGLNNNPKPDYLDDDDWKFIRSRDTPGRALADCALTLHTPQELPLSSLKELFELRHSLHSIGSVFTVKDQMSLDLAQHGVQQIAQAEKRAIRLLRLIRSSTVSQTARPFLERAARLFLWGFEPECVIICRATLEAALQTRLAQDGIIDPDDRPPPLRKLLEPAGENRVLSGFERISADKWRARRHTPLQKALRLKRTGDAMVHDFPLLNTEEDRMPDGFTALRELSRVLDDLFPL